jgi:opacity protein-like surface antigen
MSDMRSFVRRLTGTSLMFTAVLVFAAPAAAQGFGIGARFAWIKSASDVDAVDQSERFFGGQIRLSGSSIGLEVSLDRHTESFKLLNQKVKETPIQVSLLLKLAKGAFQPYLLGGPGWYYRTVEAIEGSAPDVSTHEFGWHAGGGAEVRPNRHFGIHGDYRYTFLDFGDDDGGVIGRLLPGHKGSMFTLGASVYF